MLIQTRDGIINTAHIVSAKPTAERARGTASVVLADGSATTIDALPIVIEQACGVIVPAQRGFTVRSAILPDADEDGAIHSEETVIAFRVGHGGDHLVPMPITISGEPVDDGQTLWTVCAPNGYCYGPDGDFETPEAWPAHCEYRAAVTKLMR